MKQKIKDAVMASFVADALSLGVHWVYDVALIKDKYGQLDQMVKPELASYHKSKEKGQFTHYGDQTMTLLESLSEKKGFDPDHFSQAWQAMFEDYNGYLDGATKDTIKNIASNPDGKPTGSFSSDLGGAARITPLALVYSQDVNGYISAAKAQTAMTHNQLIVIQTAEFFARTAVRVFDGEKPGIALEKSLNDMTDAPQLQQMVTAGLESKNQDTRQAIARFGAMCNVAGALPSTIHLIAKYENDLKNALLENIMAGGDSSARGLLAGFIIGANCGLSEIPETWLSDMQASQKIRDLMKDF